MRNNLLSTAFPAYTGTGFRVLKTPQHLQDELWSFWKRNEKRGRRVEDWDVASATQLNFHENKTAIVKLDIEASLRDRIANQYRDT